MRFEAVGHEIKCAPSAFDDLLRRGLDVHVNRHERPQLAAVDGGEFDDADVVRLTLSTSHSGSTSEVGKSAGRSFFHPRLTLPSESQGISRPSHASLVRSPCATNRCPTAATLAATDRGDRRNTRLVAIPQQEF